MKICDYVQSGDWKGEKHVPSIDAPASVKAGEVFKVDLCVGKEIAHPNTANHYIKWIKLFFVQDGGKFAVELATLNFDAHGESMTETPGPAFTNPCASVGVKLSASGTLIAQSYCNLHGLWESSAAVTVE